MTSTGSLAHRPNPRFEGGFDHWDPNAREGWSVVWREAERERFILGEDQTVWVWDQRVRMWKRLAPDQEATALRDHTLALNRLRRALLTVRSLDSSLETEREAARLALQRISAAIAADWLDGSPSAQASWAAGWFDHPAAIYLAVTRDCRYHFAEAQRLPFDARMFAELVTAAQDDFTAGRRAQPPRLRPDDVALMRTRAAVPEAEPSEADSSFVDQFRENLAEEISREDQHESLHKRWRRKLMMGLGSLGVAAAVATTAASVYSAGH